MTITSRQKYQVHLIVLCPKNKELPDLPCSPNHAYLVSNCNYLIRTLAGQAPLTAIAMVLVALKFRVQPKVIEDSSEQSDESEPSVAAKVRRVDFAGAFFLSVTILCILLVLDMGGEKIPWTSPVLSILAVGGTVGGLLFFCVENSCKELIFPLSMLTDKGVLVPYVIMLLQNASQMAVRTLVLSH